MMNYALMYLQAARSFGAEVDTLTLSIEQKTLAEERIRAAGLQDRIRVHLMDYRDMPIEWAGRFDAFVSVEMLEVSTPEFLPHFHQADLLSLSASACGDSTLRDLLQTR